MQQKRLRLLALFAVLSLLVAACGGGGGDTEESESATDESTEATEEDSPSEDDSATEEESPSEDESTAAAEGDGTLSVGTLLPESGSLEFLGPPMIAGVELAVEEINEAGGVLDNDVALSTGDSGDTSTDIASQTSERLLSEGADVIVGAASSGVTATVIDRITGAGVLMFSPANTSDLFTTYDDGGLYFRTAPPDLLQGRVLGDLVLNDGATSVALLALQDPYGEGLLGRTVDQIESSGGEIAAEIVYDPNAQSFDAEVQQVADAAPDAVVLIGFDESARILATMIENGLGPSEIPIYGVDGNMSATLAEQVGDVASLEGMKGTAPLPAENPEFFDRLSAFRPDLADRIYAAESYDAVVITALAAEIAGTDEPTAVAEEINGVVNDGEACASFEECVALIDGGTTDIAYQSASGFTAFLDAGEPSSGNYGILEIQADGSLETLENIEVSVE